MEKNNFEAQLKELEQIVAGLEAGNMSLDDSLKNFQAGVELSRQLEQKLTEAEQTVAKLIKSDGSAQELDPTDASTPSSNLPF